MLKNLGPFKWCGGCTARQCHVALDMDEVVVKEEDIVEEENDDENDENYIRPMMRNRRVVCSMQCSQT